MKYTSFLLVLFSLLFSSCENFKTDQEIPSYIRIQDIALKTDYSREGSARTKIYDAWVYIDNNPIGAFELPARIPVLMEGAHTVVVRAGVPINDNALLRGRYELYQSVSTNVTLERTKTTEMGTLQVSYFPNLVFPLLEDFENGDAFTDNTKFAALHTVISDSTQAYEGKRCLRVHLDADHSNFEIISRDPYVLSSSGIPYLEFNYKSSNALVAGIYITNANGEKSQIGVKTLESSNGYWKKVYLSLAGPVASQLSPKNFNIFFGTYLTQDNTSADIFIDNVKLVHQ